MSRGWFSRTGVVARSGAVVLILFTMVGCGRIEPSPAIPVRGVPTTFVAQLATKTHGDIVYSLSHTPTAPNDPKRSRDRLRDCGGVIGRRRAARLWSGAPPITSPSTRPV